MATIAPPTLPLTGRGELISSLSATLDEISESLVPAVLLSGSQGVGKSRVAQAIRERAQARGFNVAYGHASPMEVKLPYGLWTGALMPLIRPLDSDTLANLTRGGTAELATMFPHLGPDGGNGAAEGMRGEIKARLYWRFADLLRGLSAQAPTLIVLDDLHWADPSSLDLLHFVTRHVEDCPVGVLCVFTPELRHRNPGFVRAEPGLLEVARGMTVEALTRAETGELIEAAFGVDADISRAFVDDLYERTRGNPFFIEEVLKALISAGKLYQQGDAWLGWESRSTEVPASVRDALRARLAQLSEDAREAIGVAAAAGRRASFALLERAFSGTEEALIAALDELAGMGLLEETLDGSTTHYGFRHPLIHDVVYSGLGSARVGMLHRKIAAALEEELGGELTENIEEVAHHYSLARAKEVDPTAVRCLCAAGRRAMERHATDEAIQYLAAAADQFREADPSERAAWTWVGPLEDDLARAYQRVGDYDSAKGIWLELLRGAEEAADRERVAEIRRRLGQAAYWQGRHDDALHHCEEGLKGVRGDGIPVLEARLRLLRGIALEALGRGREAEEEVLAALSIAEELGDHALLARSHRALAIIYTWTGDPEKMRTHAAATIELGEAAGNRHLIYWGHWALSVMEGFLGDTDKTRQHLAECRRLAAELRSPILDIWTSEVAIELASATGDWPRGIALGEQAVARARSLGQRTLLPRLLVWLGLIYLGRGELEQGTECVEEAWELSGAGTDGPREIHQVLPAHIGLCACRAAEGRWRDAIEIGERGLRLAEETGYVTWAVHRMLPFIAESYFRLNDIEGAQAIGHRMHELTKGSGHKLGQAWADGFDALEAWHRGDIARGAELLRRAAEALEEVPMIPDAARIRRQLAGRLADIGDREGALKELRHVHDVFVRMGAKHELQKARIQFKELDARPPVMASEGGAYGLTGREVEIALLVADRMSNKAIAKALSISPHTARTHLANIYQKLGLGGRGELTDFVREKGLARDALDTGA